MDRAERERTAAYYRAIAADDAYNHALNRVYGPAAGDARYDRTRNAATPELAAKLAAKLEADRHWRSFLPNG